MARARLLRPGFFLNEQLASLSYEARLLYAGLWTIADKEGRLLDNTHRIKAQVFPYDPALNVENELGSLATAGFIKRYRKAGASYIAIPTFRKHQKPHVREAESTIPGPGRAAKSRGRAADVRGAAPPVSGDPETETEGVDPGPGLEPDHPSASLRSASPLKGSAPLHGSRRFKKNVAAGSRAVAYIRAQSAN